MTMHALGLAAHLAAAAHAAPPRRWCATSAPEGPAYRVVLLVDRSGSMQRYGPELARARDRVDRALARLAGAGAGVVGVKLARFDDGLGEVWPPAPDRWASPEEARDRLDPFFPANPSSFTGPRTCIGRSIFELVRAVSPGEVSSPADDLDRVLPWDFLVVTDEGENCASDSAAEIRWVRRNRARNLHVTTWTLSGPAPELGASSYLAVWNAPLAATANRRVAGDEIPKLSGGVVTFVPRLLGGAAGPWSCSGAVADAHPVVPVTLVQESGRRTDEGPWGLGSEPPPDKPGVFQRTWRSIAPLRLPRRLESGRAQVVPAQRDALCAALVAAAGGRAVTPVAAAGDCPLAAIDVVDRLVVALSDRDGALDRPFGRFEPSAFDTYRSAVRRVEVRLPGEARERSIRLELEAAGGGDGEDALLLPEDAALCGPDGACAGGITMKVPPGGEGAVELRVHPEHGRWWPWARLWGRRASPPEWEGPLRLCVREPGAEVRCDDCAATPEDACIAIEASVAPTGFHWITKVLAALALAAAVRWKTAPRFPPGLRFGPHELRALHRGWAVFRGRPLYIGVEGDHLAVRRRPGGMPVAEILPGGDFRAGTRCLARRSPAFRGEGTTVARDDVYLGPTYKPFSLSDDDPERTFTATLGDGRTVRGTLRLSR